MEDVTARETRAVAAPFLYLINNYAARAKTISHINHQPLTKRMSSEEELVNAPFRLGGGKSQGFVIGRIEQGDTLKISVKSEYGGDIFEVTLSSQEKGLVLFRTRVEANRTVTYRVPFSVDVAAIEIAYIGNTYTYVSNTAGVLRVAVSRSLSRVSRCPVCGAPVEPGAKYCGKCGAKLV